jgi:hypothetical protein
MGVTGPVEEALFESAGERDQVDSGVAGSSARRVYERRKSRDEERRRARFGRFGGIAGALSPVPSSTKAWETGAIGEERLGVRLDSLASSEIALLHDRGVPGTVANIDHIVITRNRVWVVDAKRYKGRPELRVEGGMLRPRTERLFVDRRDRTKMVDGVFHQIELLREVIAEVTVVGAVCFVDADWPLIGGAFTARGVHVLGPRRLAKLVSKGVDGTIDVAATKRLLASRFPTA